MTMADMCFTSLANSSPKALVILFNQGCLSNEELKGYLKKFNLNVHILGSGNNIGIAPARTACFHYIWNRHPDVQYISEIHVDMIFPNGWVEKLVDFLHTHREEPMVCPAILTSRGELHPEARQKTSISNVPLNDIEKMNKLLPTLTFDAVMEGFVHPVLHRSEILKAVGGYDTRFLKAKQGYEDDSLLLGYRYYVGLKHNWKPKCCMKVRVYHATLAQRTALPDRHESFDKNLRGLIYQYGVKGLMELSAIYQDNMHFKQLTEQLLKQL
nr:glycosyltransferase [Desulforadius tongensis]